jgi:hypothetical protein
VASGGARIHVAYSVRSLRFSVVVVGSSPGSAAHTRPFSARAAVIDEEDDEKASGDKDEEEAVDADDEKDGEDDEEQNDPVRVKSKKQKTSD